MNTDRIGRAEARRLAEDEAYAANARRNELIAN